MARRAGFQGVLMALARDAARRERLAEAEQRRIEREQSRINQLNLRAERDAARFAKAAERDAKARFVVSRELEADRLNDEVNERMKEISNILISTLAVDDAIAFDSLLIKDTLPPFTIPKHLVAGAPAPSKDSFLSAAAVPRGVSKFLPGAKSRHAEAIRRANASFEEEFRVWQTDEDRRQQSIDQLRARYEVQRRELSIKAEARRIEVDSFRESYFSGEQAAIVAYNEMVLERSRYPDDFPQQFSIAYSDSSRQILVEYELPSVDVIPAAESHRYNRSSDEITVKRRKSSDIRSAYADLIASIALRTLHEIFEADQAGVVDTCCFNGYVNALDPSTGKGIRPHIVSVRTTKSAFEEIDLARVNKIACLRNLGAQVSRSADEAQPVRPIVEFRMNDARFIDQTDLVSELESAKNLMDLNPYEFEQLVANLFEKMGLESKLTRSSRDGGVDCIAYDKRPVLGGKVVIQAKRYKNTVGVAAVRDLYGTMMNEGANKGILVATSGYGSDAFEFAKDKPIELIDGGGLLFLLQEIGQSARIVFPED